MRWRAKWSHVTIALAVFAAAAIVTPAIGEQSGTTTISKKTLKKLIKKEVSKQIAKATGPQGPAGANGANGTNGTNHLTAPPGPTRLSMDRSVRSRPQSRFAPSHATREWRTPRTSRTAVSASVSMALAPMTQRPLPSSRQP